MGGVALLAFALVTGAGAQENEEEEETTVGRPSAAAASLTGGETAEIDESAGEDVEEDAEEDAEEDDPPDHDAGSSSTDPQRSAESPALVVMGNSDLEISRPRTPSALAATLLSSFTDGGYLPDGLAVEVTPFWLFPHPNLTLERYSWGVAGKARMRAQDRKRAKLLADDAPPDAKEAIGEGQRALQWSLAEADDATDPPGAAALAVAEAINARETFDTREERRDKADF